MKEFVEAAIWKNANDFVKDICWIVRNEKIQDRGVVIVAWAVNAEAKKCWQAEHYSVIEIEELDNGELDIYQAGAFPTVDDAMAAADRIALEMYREIYLGN